jgi:protein MpaA
MSKDKHYLAQHRSHDYGATMRRWKEVSRKAGLRTSELVRQGGYPVYGIRSRKFVAGQPVLYVSAGCHGDEPAAVQGLLAWAEENTKILAKRNVVLMPCLNPWGLANNVRLNQDGEDLNRLFHRTDHPLIGAWAKFTAGVEFPLAVTLHEDYDANGIYLYELNPVVGHSYGEGLLQICEKIIPREPGSSIEGRKAVRGIVRRTRGVPKIDGLPEAITMFVGNATASLTFETPSEFSLFDRVRAQKAFVAGLFRFNWPIR